MSVEETKNTVQGAVKGVSNLLSNPVTVGIGAAVTATAVLLISWELGKWLNRARRAKEAKDLEAIRKAQQEANQRANAESDRLREIDGR